MCDYKRQMCNTAAMPPIFALRLTPSGVVVLAPDENPHMPAWHCVGSLPLPRPPASEASTAR